MGTGGFTLLVSTVSGKDSRGNLALSIYLLVTAAVMRFVNLNSG